MCDRGCVLEVDAKESDRGGGGGGYGKLMV